MGDEIAIPHIYMLLVVARKEENNAHLVKERPASRQDLGAKVPDCIVAQK